MPIAFFRCAPTASIGATGSGSRTGSGAYPRARRSTISRPSTHLDDRVVDVSDDRAIVDEKQIGDATQPVERLALVDADRLVGEIAARRHDGPADVPHQQMMERRVGQHHAEVRVARRHRRRNR